MIGKTLGHYQVSSQLGKGGMGEVYQAKDLTLGRDVAIKVLPEELAKDADRVARFQREAKLLASLNHPNIAAIYGLESSEGTNFLVLELVEGETLSDQIKKGPIPVEESLKLALQIAEALEAAHEKGVIHRDLKPANIKVTPDGKVKVLDFGLAKALAAEQSELNLSNSPTLSNAATQMGVILGTAAYMAPEQARGKSVDKRADIWAFGCVLFEMLTGQTAFQGEDVTEILAAVVKSSANLDLLPVDTHSRVRELISRCLQKDLKKRYQDVGDVRYELDQIATHPEKSLSSASTEEKSRRRQVFSWLASLVVLAMVITGVTVWTLKPTPPSQSRQVIRYSFELPKGQQFSNLGNPSLAISPDGRQIVYSTSEGLYLLRLDQLDSELIPGSDDNPERPVFSPDGNWIGYVCRTDSQLKKIAVSGGAPVILGAAPSVGTFNWGRDNSIVFDQMGKGIMRISANGGDPETVVSEQKTYVIHPQILPDGKSVMFTQFPQPYRIMVQLKSGERKEVAQGNTSHYLPTGHIVYATGNTLFAIPFNLNSLNATGGPVSVVENVMRRGGGPQYAISDSGTLVYVPDFSTTCTLLWVDRDGKEEPLATPPNIYLGPRISPDGTRVAMGAEYGVGGIDVCVWNLARKTLTRLTFDPAEEDFPLWTPDGKRIAFASFREGYGGLYLKSADGTGSDELLRKGQWIFPNTWSADDKALLTQELYPENVVGSNFHIGSLSLEGERKWKSLLQQKHMDVQPRISPNGRWLAYTSNESGRNEIYVRPYPDVNTGMTQISPEGGDSPLWSLDGWELFYRNGDAALAVSVKTDVTLSVGTPKILFRGSYVAANFNNGTLELNPWDISPEGKRFLMMKETDSMGFAAKGPRKIIVVVNWFEELKKRVPMK